MSQFWPLNAFHIVKHIDIRICDKIEQIHRFVSVTKIRFETAARRVAEFNTFQLRALILLVQIRIVILTIVVFASCYVFAKSKKQ